jgi:hypothetical protein
MGNYMEIGITPNITLIYFGISPGFQGQVGIYTLFWVVEWTNENDTGMDMISHVV